MKDQAKSFLHYLANLTRTPRIRQEKVVSLPKKSRNIALLVCATGKYLDFVPPLVDSAKRFFLPTQKVHFFIFSDGTFSAGQEVTFVPHKVLGWPLDTMKRFEIFYRYQELYQGFDYLFSLDADMMFVETCGEEILGKRVGTLHPGFIRRRGSYETRSASKAFVPSHEGRHYFAGGFYGGQKEVFLELVRTCADNIERDLQQDIVAVWHDESHLNRYFIDNPPTRVLNPSYCYPEGVSMNYQPKLMALLKDHQAVRSKG